MPKVTAKQAEDIRAAIEKRFISYTHSGEYGRPKLFDHTHENTSPGSWSIIWEEGPTDWVYDPFGEFTDWEIYSELEDLGHNTTAARNAAIQEAVTQPHADRVFIEPINSAILGLYPA